MRTALLLAAVVLTSAVSYADVQWSRLHGKVKAVNGKKSEITIQNREGDLLTVKVDEDVEIVKGKAALHLKDIEIDDKVTLLYLPKAPTPKESDEQPVGGYYPPAKK